jgi:hypothetical protein
MADWVTISSLATAGGTLVLAMATFSSVRSANRSTSLAERSLLAAQRPVLIPSREDDPEERVGFGDGAVLHVPGHGAALTIENDRIYMAIGLRNGGAGVAVLHGWRVEVGGTAQGIEAPDVSSFRRQQRDLYIPAGDSGFWQGALRDPDEPMHAEVLGLRREEGQRLFIDLLYGDHEGGQRAIARFSMRAFDDFEGKRAEILRYWNVDGEQPR